MDAELCAAELMARNSHEHPECPGTSTSTWRGRPGRDRHAEVHDRLMATELGCRWGDSRSGSATSSRSTASTCSPPRAVQRHERAKAMWRHSHRRKVLVELGQTTVGACSTTCSGRGPALHNGVRWGSHLLGGTEGLPREGARSARGSTPLPRGRGAALGPALAAGLAALGDGLLGVSNGLRAKRPALPGALPAAPPVPRIFCPPPLGMARGGGRGRPG